MIKTIKLPLWSVGIILFVIIQEETVKGGYISMFIVRQD